MTWHNRNDVAIVISTVKVIQSVYVYSMFVCILDSGSESHGFNKDMMIKCFTGKHVTGVGPIHKYLSL